MGKRGPKAARADGCHVTASGYLRGTFRGRLRFQHVEVWERAHGPIPKGWWIHHRNENKQDNRLRNLRLVTHAEHKRLHGGCVRKGSQWFKPCGACRRMLRLDASNFYLSAEGWPLYGRCRRCHIRCVVEAKKARKAKRENQKTLFDAVAS